MSLDSDYRLPKSVTPKRYEIILRPDFDSSTFTGRMALTLDVHEITSDIVMNAVDIGIQELYLLMGNVSLDDLEIDIDEYSPLYCSSQSEEEQERLLITAPVDLNPGSYTLVCGFSGVLNDKLRGFYRSVYKDDSGAEHIIATTQFEQTDARRAFPCFDEPDFKAVFGVSLEVPQNMLAVSNSKEIASTPLEDGYKRISFADTIRMSTYLVAFIVGNLEATPYRTVRDIPVRVICVPGKLHLTKLALDAAEHALEYFENYFDTDYPGDKLDLVAIPDFAAGAMENLGCVTFREAILLVDEDRASRPELERLTEVVEHELAHMWFGDLVTMKWWNGIWLNEAFATFMSMKCQTDFKPEWRPFDSFARERAAAFSIDALHSTRPIEIEVRHPDDAAAMFDVLTYEKGASVLWMIEQYLGENIFRDGIRHYLKLHRLQNTETHDLWDSLESVAGDIEVRKIMDSFIFQGGFPLLHVTSTDALTDGKEYRITQEPFSYLTKDEARQAVELLVETSDKEAELSGIGKSWFIPAVITTGIDKSDSAKVIIGQDQEPLRSSSDILIANSKGTGYYRVFYDNLSSKQLLEKWDLLTPLERFCFISDSWNLVVAKKMTLADFISLTAALADETDPHIWSVVLGALSLLSIISSKDDLQYLQNFTRSLILPHIDDIGWERNPAEKDDFSLLRASFLAALGNTGNDEKTISYAKDIFATERKNPNAVDQDIFPAVLEIVAHHATDAEFDSILERMLTPIDPIDQKRHLNALAKINNESYADRLYQLSVDTIRSQDAPFLLGAMLSSRKVGVSTWKFIENNYNILANKFPDNALDRMMSGISALACSPENIDTIDISHIASFIKASIRGGRQRLSAQNLERLIVNRSLTMHLSDQIRSCLQ